MDAQKKLQTFIISLPKDKHRRDFLGKQLQDLGLPYSIANAVHGASLSSEEIDACYDREKSVRLFNRELSRGELGCALSHIGIYRTMVEENIPYALILEDDAKILAEDLPATLARLTQAYWAETPVAVLLNHVRRYDAGSERRLDERHALYDAYRGVCAHGYFLTRAGAQALLRDLYPVYVVADKWEYFQEHFLPVKALVPYPIGLTPACLTSSIDAMGERVRKIAKGRNLRYYARKILTQVRSYFRSRRFVRIEHQDKHSFDLH